MSGFNITKSKMIIKNIRNEKYTIEYDETETFDNFCTRVKNTMGIDGDIRLINMGSIINSSNYSSVNNESILICTNIKKRKVNVNTENTNEEINNVNDSNDVSPETETSTETSTGTETSTNTTQQRSIDEMKVFLITFLTYMRTNRVPHDVYMNDFQHLIYSIKTNDSLDVIIRQMVGNIDNMLVAYQNNQDMAMTLEVRPVEDAVQNNDNDNINSTSMNIDSDEDGSLGSIEDSFDDTMNDTSNTNTNNPTTLEYNFTTADHENIQNLIDMGFQSTKVIYYYVKSGKNINDTLDMLQSE